jgi:L-serine deaminase
MRDKSARKQIDTAIGNVESALRDLSDRLEEIVPGRRRLRNRVARAEDRLRRTAHSVADRLPRERTASLVESAERTVRAHPVEVALTAAIAGYCAWSILRFANGRSSMRKERLGPAGRLRAAADAARERIDVRH